VELLGGIVNDGVLTRLHEAGSQGEVYVASRTVTHPAYPKHRADAHAGRADRGRRSRLRSECFGPVRLPDLDVGTDESITLFRDTVQAHGAMTASVYSTSDAVIEQTRDAALDAGVALSENLLGGVFVNQSAAYSTSTNRRQPGANASYTTAPSRLPLPDRQSAATSEDTSVVRDVPQVIRADLPALRHGLPGGLWITCAVADFVLRKTSGWSSGAGAGGSVRSTCSSRRNGPRDRHGLDHPPASRSRRAGAAGRSRDCGTPTSLAVDAPAAT